MTSNLSPSLESRPIAEAKYSSSAEDIKAIGLAKCAACPTRTRETKIVDSAADIQLEDTLRAE
ncbi:hypothetical protein [Aurantiacibacter sp. MUD61]|uniref:hypothetical protein n=1 Tax=Aurantiacibacter sp. MUD61 TaxID=3009083 RepID=UPI0022F0513B|nr:hypothetical protein [Aurantiacibacter sp. MUD61]